MEKVSQVIERNLDALNGASLLLIDPPCDGLAGKLEKRCQSVAVSTRSRGDWRWLTAGGTSAEFQAFPAIPREADTVILFLPREKERLQMMLHAIADRASPSVRLWLVGENDAGIKSSPRYLKAFFGEVEKRDAARHCCLFEARQPVRQKAFNPDEYVQAWNGGFAGHPVEIQSLPGVFAHGRLDKGSGLLMDVLDGMSPSGRILDFACGSGVLGLSLLKRWPKLEMTLLDDSALAIEAARRSLEANGLKAELVASDGLDEAHGCFDWIVSNPPFHRGVGDELEISAAFFRNAGTFLAPRGKILIVCNRHLPYFGWLQQHYESVEKRLVTREFLVLEASDPS